MQLQRNLLLRGKSLVRKHAAKSSSLPSGIARNYRKNTQTCGVPVHCQSRKTTANALGANSYVNNNFVCLFHSSSFTCDPFSSENGGIVEGSPAKFNAGDMFNTIETIEVLLQAKTRKANDSRSVAVEKALLWILRHCSKQDLNLALTSLRLNSNRFVRKSLFGDRSRSDGGMVDENKFRRETMNAALLFRQFKSRKRKKSMQLLTYLLGTERLQELTLQSKCAIIKSLQVNGIVAKNKIVSGSDVEELIEKLILSTLGEDLTDLKNLLMAGDAMYNLQKLIFEDISEELKKKILRHIEEQALELNQAKDSHNNAKPVKVLSDIDDTIFCALHDRRYPRHSVYPGVRAFLDALDMNLSREGKPDIQDRAQLKMAIRQCINNLVLHRKTVKRNVINDHGKMKSGWDSDSYSDEVSPSYGSTSAGASNSMDVLNSLDDELFVDYNDTDVLHSNSTYSTDQSDKYIRFDVEHAQSEKCSNISEIGERRREGPTSGDSSHGSLENDIRINNVAFLTARPKGWRSLITTLTRNKLNRKGVSQHATLLSGSFKNLFSSKQMADKKFMNFCEYCDLFPEYDYVLLGDSGQGDARLGLMALKHDTGKFATRIRAVFLHDVTEGKTKTGDGKPKEHYQNHGLLFHRNYVEAANKAMELGLIDLDAFVRIANAATKDLISLSFGKSMKSGSRNILRINEIIDVLEEVQSRCKD